MLTSDAFARARAYLFEYGRPLDRERFRFHFESGSVGAVLAELAAYQNRDGGFGHGLEADIRAETSSPIATAMAFRVLREVGLPKGDLVERGLDYLRATYDRDRSVWPMVPPEVESAPHAPWWNYAETPKNFADFHLNPTAEILGALYDYGAEVPDGLTDAVLSRAEASADPVEHNTFSAVATLARAANLPDGVRAALRARLLRSAPGSIAFDPSTWERYELEPLEALRRPDDFLAEAVPAQVIRANIEHTLRRQGPDGSWPLTWDWAFVDAAGWAQAERDWKGKLIVDKLRTLRAFGAA